MTDDDAALLRTIVMRHDDDRDDWNDDSDGGIALAVVICAIFWIVFGIGGLAWFWLR